MPPSSPKGPQRPQLDDFVARLVPDPANPPDAVVLQGFLGASDADDHLRVYTDPSLSSYVDIPNASVLHSERLPADQSPLGGSMVWVERSAAVRSPAAAASQAGAADFLRGPIQEALGAVTQAFGCPSTSTCPTHGGCLPQPSLGIACTVVSCPPAPTRLLGCASLSCPPTNMLGCPRTSTCPPTNMLGCPRTSTCPPQPTIATVCTQIGCPPPPTQGIVCMTGGCPVTMHPGCPNTSTCTPQPPVEELTRTVGCYQVTVNGCTMYGCLPATIGCLPPSMACVPQTMSFPC